jgi:hypothetical protein
MLSLAAAEPARLHVDAIMISGLTPNADVANGNPHLGFQLGGGLEVAVRVLSFLRLELDFVGARVVTYDPYIELRGYLRLLAGADAFLTYRRLDLFIGLAAGLIDDDRHLYATVVGGNNPPPGTRPELDIWEWLAALRARAGIEVQIWDPLRVGASLGYGFSGGRNRSMHWIELTARVGVAF